MGDILVSIAWQKALMVNDEKLKSMEMLDGDSRQISTKYLEFRRSGECFAEGVCNDYDAVVIGSGYGGSVAACRLAMGGLRVCLLEKGRKWEAQDFPTDTSQMLSAVRMEHRTFGVSFGPKDSLYQLQLFHSWACSTRVQVCRHDDSVAAMACGLGGGSLVNAGVVVPTPARTRRNPKWPKDWEKDWEVCEALASTMLRIQDVPIKFRNARIMDEAVGEETGFKNPEPLKLTVNFDTEDQMYSSKKFGKADSCQACGNCMSGCPYNAKNSTDKTYLLSAIQAGCDIRTACEVQYVFRNLDDTSEVDEAICRRKSRRWLVFLNEFECIASDFVVLSAGVFGTTKVLFQSQMRGLILSKKLGCGLSCNGNNVAYLSRSRAPLNACGLDRKKLPEVPFEERPGPSITSSYISSLGFTIQSAVIPIAFPWLLFKGITTYGWPIGYNILDSIVHKVKHLFGQPSQDMVLNVIGYDNGDGKLTFRKDTNEICFQPPSDPLLARKIEALQRITKKLGGILFMSRYRSTSVHLLGGCCSSSDASSGVCNSNGQVFDTLNPTTVYPGLYVCDGSLIPCSVGINPCLTIATAAEHVSKHPLQDALDYKSKDVDFVRGKPVEKKSLVRSWKSEISRGSAVHFKETMRGHVGGLPCVAYLKLKLNARRTSEKTIGDFREPNPILQGKVSGHVMCSAIEMDKLHVIDGEVDLCHVDIKTPYTQYMHYRLLLAASSGSRYILEGKKVMNPFLLGLDAWKDSTTLHVVLRKISQHTSEEVMISLKGKLHISMIELLKSLFSMSGKGKMKFLHILLQSLFRTYISQVPRASQKGFTPLDPYQNSYPRSTLHEIRTEDGIIISCQQWKCNQEPQRQEEGNKPFPVLLINGYATESYCLPTESNDLVRSLLHQGHETWLLQTRLLGTSSSINMTVEAIGMFDIPAAINKISELHGESVKIHVVAHCVGGLAIHIALMGGHVFYKRIASLSCTNSSMFFKLTAWSKFKLWLPLIPVSTLVARYFALVHIECGERVWTGFD
nr:uncharacterized protein LOC113693325 [Coffea arabica]